MNISINNKKYRDNKSKFPDFFRELDCHEINEIHIIMKKEYIDFGFAYNVYTKRYSLDEAKRRQYLKNRQQSGKSMDMFDVARRRSRSYHWYDINYQPISKLEDIGVVDMQH